jgi:hypothetical protein
MCFGCTFVAQAGRVSGDVWVLFVPFLILIFQKDRSESHPLELRYYLPNLYQLFQ